MKTGQSGRGGRAGEGKTKPKNRGSGSGSGSQSNFLRRGARLQREGMDSNFRSSPAGARVPAALPKCPSTDHRSDAKIGVRGGPPSLHARARAWDVATANTQASHRAPPPPATVRRQWRRAWRRGRGRRPGAPARPPRRAGVPPISMRGPSAWLTPRAPPSAHAPGLGSRSRPAREPPRTPPSRSWARMRTV